MQCARAIPVTWLGSGSCQVCLQGWILMMNQLHMDFNGVFLCLDAFGKTEGVRKQTVKKHWDLHGQCTELWNKVLQGFYVSPSILGIITSDHECRQTYSMNGKNRKRQTKFDRKLCGKATWVTGGDQHILAEFNLSNQISTWQMFLHQRNCFYLHCHTSLSPAYSQSCKVLYKTCHLLCTVHWQMKKS